MANVITSDLSEHVKQFPNSQVLFEDLSHEDVAQVIACWQSNPVQAAVDIFGFQYGLPSHQTLALKLAWGLSDVIQVWTRGGGKTFFLSMFAWLSAVLFPEEKIGIFGPSFRQAKFVWAEVERAYDKSPILQELCKKQPTITPDKCHARLYNGSIIEALPLGDGSKIRGARYYRLLCDEAAQIPEDILDIVLGGMRATTKDPMYNVWKIKEQREAVMRGELLEEDIVEAPTNKMLLTSTAFYQFNHLWRRVKMFESEIMNPDNKDLDPQVMMPGEIMWNKNRAVVMFDYRDPPEGFMNMGSIMEMKKKMSDVKWKMEYCHYFPPDSEGFHRRSKIEAARGHNRYTVELSGNLQDNYVLGIDVARNSDNFAIAVCRVAGNTVELVATYTLNSREFPEMHDLIREIIRQYNVIYMCMDTGGGGTSLEDLLHDERMCPEDQELIWDSVSREEFKEKEGWHTLEMVKFSDDSIPKMAYQLQADIDHKRFLFPSEPSMIREIAENGFDDRGASIEDLEKAYEEINETIEETTAIIAQSTRTGKTHLGLPGEISKNYQSEEANLYKPPRKDRWVAIMLANWAAHRRLRQMEVEDEKPDDPEFGFSLYGALQSSGSIPTHVYRRRVAAMNRRK